MNEQIQQPFATPEDCFKKVIPELKEKFVELAKDAIDNFYFQYLPYVNTDTDSNAYHIANEQLLKLLEGKVPGGMGSVDSVTWQWQRIRAKILEENKDEVIKALFNDKDEEIERLQNSITQMSQGRY